MDGTLYELQGGSFKASGLFNVIVSKTVLYIERNLDKTTEEAKEILKKIFEQYGNSISIGLEKEFNIDRHVYFNFVWDIDAEKHVQLCKDIFPLLQELKKQYRLVLVSDAPRIWVNNVLQYLGVSEIFGEDIFSGEGDVRKEFNNAFLEIAKKIGVEPRECVVIGDQEETDIVPANKVGMKTVFIGDQISSCADYSIKSLLELSKIENF